MPRANPRCRIEICILKKGVRRNAQLRTSARGAYMNTFKSNFIRHASWSAERAGGIWTRAHLPEFLRRVAIVQFGRFLVLGPRPTSPLFAWYRIRCPGANSQHTHLQAQANPIMKEGTRPLLTGKRQIEGAGRENAAPALRNGRAERRVSDRGACLIGRRTGWLWTISISRGKVRKSVRSALSGVHRWLTTTPPTSTWDHR